MNKEEENKDDKPQIDYTKKYTHDEFISTMTAQYLEEFKIKNEIKKIPLSEITEEYLLLGESTIGKNNEGFNFKLYFHGDFLYLLRNEVTNLSIEQMKKAAKEGIPMER